MYIFKFVLLLFACSTAYSQDLIVNPDYKGDICLYDSPGSKVIEGIKTKGIDKGESQIEDYLVLNVKTEQKEWFYGTLRWVISKKKYIGWFKKEDYLGVYVRNYGQNKIVQLYSKPDFKSSPTVEIGSDFKVFCNVKNTAGDWVYVVAKYNSSQVEGWLQPDEQCVKPYSICD